MFLVIFGCSTLLNTDGNLRFKNKYFFVCNDNIFHTFANGIMVLLPCK